MAYYDGTYGCGHEGRINIIGPGKDRQWKADREFSSLCPDCRKKQVDEERKRKNEEAAQAAKEMELPDLKGSEKQVAWANALRVEFINLFQKRVRAQTPAQFHSIKEELSAMGIELRDGVAESMLAMLDYMVKSKDKATFWIDNRERMSAAAISLLKEMNNQEEKAVPEDILEEATAKPENSTHSGIVKISGDDSALRAAYVKDGDFRTIVKKYGLSWDGSSWSRNLNEYTGSYQDRAAELGNALLHEGFTIQILDLDALQMAVNGGFREECKRWIKYSSKSKKVTIKWTDEDDIYQNAKKLPGARYQNGFVHVSPEFYKEIYDFVETYGYRISSTAKAQLASCQQADERLKTIVPETVDAPESQNKLQDYLKSSGAIIEDLEDPE